MQWRGPLHSVSSPRKHKVPHKIYNCYMQRFIEDRSCNSWLSSSSFFFSFSFGLCLIVSPCQRPSRYINDHLSGRHNYFIRYRNDEFGGSSIHIVNSCSEMRYPRTCINWLELIRANYVTIAGILCRILALGWSWSSRWTCCFM